MNDIWYEVWTDESTDIPYILLLIYRSEGPEWFAILDPREGNRLVFAASSYEEAKLWLLEDEFDQVNGRMSDGTPQSGHFEPDSGSIRRDDRIDP